MFEHIRDIRTKFLAAIEQENISGNWKHIVRDLGLFSYTPLPNEVAKALKNKHHIYISSDGRMSFAGISNSFQGIIAELLERQIPFVVSCIKEELSSY